MDDLMASFGGLWDVVLALAAAGFHDSLEQAGDNVAVRCPMLFGRPCYHFAFVRDRRWKSGGSAPI